MKFIPYVKITALIFISIMAGCGGGGGGGGTVSQPTQAVLKLSTSPFAPYTTLGGVQVRIGLPVGTSVATNGSGAVLNSVVTPIGVLASSGQVQFVSYSAPTVSSTGAIKFFMVTPQGNTTFKSGEFAQVICGLSGSTPAKSSFLLTLTATSADGHSAAANESFTLTVQ